MMELSETTPSSEQDFTPYPYDPSSRYMYTYEDVEDLEESDYNDDYESSDTKENADQPRNDLSRNYQKYFK